MASEYVIRMVMTNGYEINVKGKLTTVFVSYRDTTYKAWPIGFEAVTLRGRVLVSGAKDHATALSEARKILETEEGER